MEELEELRAEQANIINWLRGAEDELAALQDQTAEMIGNIEVRKRQIESVYEKLHRIEDRIIKLS